MQKEISRRQFLKAIGGFGFTVGLNLLNPLLFGQTLEDKIRRRRAEALHPEPKGFFLSKYRFPLEIGNEKIKVHLDFEYFQGPKGVGGALRTYVYLDEKSWYDKKGIKKLKIIFYSTKKTSISKEIYEVNVNNYKERVTHCPIDYVVLPGDYLTKKFEAGVYAILKKAKIKKKDINKVFWVKDLFEDIKEQDLLEKIIEKGNDITGQSVYIKTVDYNGYGFLDDKNLEGRLRAPKLVRVELLRGDQSVKAIGVIVEVVDFKDVYLLKKQIGTKTIKGSSEFFINYDVENLTKDVDFPKEEN